MFRTLWQASYRVLGLRCGAFLCMLSGSLAFYCPAVRPVAAFLLSGEGIGYGKGVDWRSEGWLIPNGISESITFFVWNCVFW